MSTDPVADAFAVLERITGKLKSGELTVDELTRAAVLNKRTCEMDMRPAAAEACRTCPWRRDNADSDDPLLSEEALVGHWELIRDGGTFACHKTFVVAPSEAQRAHGWKETPDSATPRECVGALAQLQKEERLRDELGSNRAYADVRGPHGVTPQGFNRLAQRRQGLPGTVPMRNLDHPEQYGRPWFPDPVGADTLAFELPCFCPVCKRHDEIHEPIELTPPGSDQPVTVDATLAPLLKAVWGAGIVTTASCENMREAVSRLWVSELGRLESEPGVYQHVMREGLAFVRGIDSDAWAPLTAVVERLPTGQVWRSAPLIQIAFPLDRVDELVAAW